MTWTKEDHRALLQACPNCRGAQQVMVVAGVTADGEPIPGGEECGYCMGPPTDGVIYRAATHIESLEADLTRLRAVCGEVAASVRRMPVTGDREARFRDGVADRLEKAAGDMGGENG